ncbi:MAG: hypothetical protein ABW252_00310 [Polyangiales bacterium]
MPRAVQNEPAEADAPRDPYDQLIDGALAEFAHGHWGEARTLFERAHLLRPSARTFRALGMSAFNLHRYAQAVAELEAAQGHAEQPLDPAMRAHAAELVRRASPLVGRFTVTLAPPDGALTVDDAAPVRDPDGRVLLDIGQHQLALDAPGHAAARQALAVHGGEDDALALHALPLTTRAARAPTGTRPRRALSGRARLALGLASAGLAIAASGLASWLRADRRFDDQASACRARGGCLPGTVDLTAVRRLERLGHGLGGAGAGLMLGGVAFGALELFGGKETP